MSNCMLRSMLTNFPAAVFKVTVRLTGQLHRQCHQTLREIQDLPNPETYSAKAQVGLWFATLPMGTRIHRKQRAKGMHAQSYRHSVGHSECLSYQHEDFYRRHCPSKYFMSLLNVGKNNPLRNCLQYNASLKKKVHILSLNQVKELYVVIII